MDDHPAAVGHEYKWRPRRLVSFKLLPEPRRTLQARSNAFRTVTCRVTKRHGLRAFGETLHKADFSHA